MKGQIVVPKASSPENFLFIGREYKILDEFENTYCLMCVKTRMTTTVFKYRVEFKKFS